MIIIPRAFFSPHRSVGLRGVTVVRDSWLSLIASIKWSYVFVFVSFCLFYDCTVFSFRAISEHPQFIDKNRNFLHFMAESPKIIMCKLSFNNVKSTSKISRYIHKNPTLGGWWKCSKNTSRLLYIRNIGSFYQMLHDIAEHQDILGLGLDLLIETLFSKHL